MKRAILGVLFLALSFVGCSRDNSLAPNQNNNRQFGIFKVLNDDITIEMEGDITSLTLNDFNNMVQLFPNVNKINMKDCPGSSDDIVNLQVSTKVHQKGMTTHVTDNSQIASGAVDFFVAGVRRTNGTNTKIGVHSWEGDGKTATDFPVGDPNHLLYINYYVSVGFTQQQAEDFYYFTINAAPAASIHWMTEAEITRYKLLTN